MKFKELEKLLLADGWQLKNVKGSHHQYTHPTKCAKVTIPRHGGDVDIKVVNSVLRHAGMK